MSIKNNNDKDQKSKKQKSQNTFRPVKFNFTDIKKFITMDLNIKVAFDDLKMNFSKLLNTSFFAKKLVFYKKEKKETIIDPTKSLELMLEG